MNQQEIDLLRYPIGKFSKPKEFSRDIILQNIETISQYPEQLKNEVLSLSEDELKWTFKTRP